MLKEETLQQNVSHRISTIISTWLILTENGTSPRLSHHVPCNSSTQRRIVPKASTKCKLRGWQQYRQQETKSRKPRGFLNMHPKYLKLDSCSILVKTAINATETLSTSSADLCTTRLSCWIITFAEPLQTYHQIHAPLMLLHLIQQQDVFVQIEITRFPSFIGTSLSLQVARKSTVKYTVVKGQGTHYASSCPPLIYVLQHSFLSLWNRE